jgi:DMSO/TMAO reductase YedYZ molybdopterin-dependent catalytic subunit
MRLLVAAVTCAIALAAPAQQPASFRAENGFSKPTVFDAAAIEKCAPRDVIVRIRDAAPRRYTGCPLGELLRQAEPAEARPRDLRRSYFLVSASDGYQVVFSWAELFLTPLGDDVIVAYRRDGRPLGDDEGPLALVSGMDTSAARHVKNLQAIELRVGR